MALPPPPFELNGNLNFFCFLVFNKFQKNFTPSPPPPLNGLTISGGIFFSASLEGEKKELHKAPLNYIEFVYKTAMIIWVKRYKINEKISWQNIYEKFKLVYFAIMQSNC